MSGSKIDEIKSRISIEEVVGEQVELSLAGKNLKGLCPFHNEKTPSFTVSPDRGTYYCFGCGAKGDIFSFLQEHQGMEFKDALKILADKAGVILDSYEPKDKSESDKRLKILEKATYFFEEKLLESREAKDYVINRGISAETRNNFRIGYAPNDWHSLHNEFEKDGVEMAILEEVGLIKKGDKGPYDYFRDRIMFPIFNNQGNVIGFSGRLLHKDDKSAKYVNSPESPIFYKSEILFGLNFAKNQMRRTKEAILVEGQVDLIMAHQAGTTNALATSGTAFTDEHAEILAKYVDTVIIAYDGDMAGQKAAARAWDILLSKGLSVKVVSMPEGQDPADIITNSISEWKNIINTARPLIEYMTDKIYSIVSDSHKRIKLIEEKVLPKLRFIKSNVEKNYFITYLAQKTNLQEDILWHHTGKKQQESKKQDSIHLEAFPLDSELKSIIAWQETLPEAERVLEVEKFKTNLKEIYDLCEEDFSDNFEVEDEQIFVFEEKYQNKDDLKKHAEEVFKNLSKNLIKAAIAHLSEYVDQSGEKADDSLMKIHILTKKSKEIGG